MLTQLKTQMLKANKLDRRLLISEFFVFNKNYFKLFKFLMKIFERLMVNFIGIESEGNKAPAWKNPLYTTTKLFPNPNLNTAGRHEEGVWAGKPSALISQFLADSWRVGETACGILFVLVIGDGVDLFKDDARWMRREQTTNLVD